MKTTTHEHKTFDKIIFSQERVKKRIFENCTFTNCDFSNSNLDYNEFIDSKFINCNMALAKLNSACLKNVSFQDSKLIGISFYECLDFLFHVNFDNCLLDYASFVGKKMTKTKFINCSLKDANFSDTDLTDSIFDNCNLSGTIFNKTQLKNADFRTAFNFAMDLDLNFIKKAKFSRSGLEGLLAKYDIVIDQ